MLNKNLKIIDKYSKYSVQANQNVIKRWSLRTWSKMFVPLRKMVNILVEKDVLRISQNVCCSDAIAIESFTVVVIFVRF